MNFHAKCNATTNFESQLSAGAAIWDVFFIINSTMWCIGVYMRVFVNFRLGF